ncbi:MAG: hypothetical protein LH702_01195 [Phormidesmis sp. CAN_BIN44]|nr:hypothetical protein [Phormidesmis sp. CAN_BIN44]
MDNVDVKSVLSILTFLAGAGSAVLGMVRWYGISERKRYAAERDFGHLRNNQEQMKQSLHLLAEELDEMASDFKTQNACFQILMAQSGQTVSGLFAQKPKRNDENDAR